ncbi:NAD(+) synthase [Anaeromicropila populeti]|uniref:Glutamine-dependent NAD(+) synthetase n=1 Tax=Anaeromicropila populeti TaxID=37658 RepID=A0A1I6HQ88_9FIRM|nr:NAD(+) synthase [Anaeromicropila populeti]SFR56527.1 NAD+ synthase (glutamine-hydrolysing) [Anaeromicropila populeti]
MYNGYVKVCAATPKIKVADPRYNANQIMELVKKNSEAGAKIIVFPELCLTGYTCSDLFLQDILLEGALRQLEYIAKETKDRDVLVFVGLPFMKEGKLYNVAAGLANGKILGLVPKSYIPNYSEFYEARHFTKGRKKIEYVNINGQEGIPFSTNILFRCTNQKDLLIGVDICEDLWVPVPPSCQHVLKGATVIVNLSASDETTGKDMYRRELVRNHSAKLICGYLYADAGEGESSTDLVFGAHNIIAENGTVLAEAERFQNETVISELDLERLVNERRRMSTFPAAEEMEQEYVYADFYYKGLEETVLTRFVDKAPFVPGSKSDRDRRCREILTIQALGLKKRLEHTNAKTVVVGISGGLDSTLALLVIAKAFDLLKLERKNIIAVTMPCFGTTDRTYQNAVNLTLKLGATLKEIPISEEVTMHLDSIGHDMKTHDVTYENAQARIRTLVLMNMANLYNGLVIGTGDLSELALGWATYNGDHMSMYGVNASVPKTLVKYLVLYYAETVVDEELSKLLLDILDTPVSPELLPPKEGAISQRTEDIVGPYELHDFFLYYVMRFGYRPSKIFVLASYAFGGTYDKNVIYKWLTTFYKRFFSQQYKRSCLPDGPKVGSVAVSPRGDLRMPSDAVAEVWLEDLRKLEDKYGVGF